MGKFSGVLLASDYDDTLYDTSGSVSRENREAIGYFLPCEHILIMAGVILHLPPPTQFNRREIGLAEHQAVHLLVGIPPIALHKEAVRTESHLADVRYIEGMPAVAYADTHPPLVVIHRRGGGAKVRRCEITIIAPWGG